MRVRLAFALTIALVGAVAAPAESLTDGFAGVQLRDGWAWANEDRCAGNVENGLILSPISGYRQAAIGTVRNTYTWYGSKTGRDYEFTLGDWSLRSNSHVSVRMYLVGNGAGTQPDRFSDYNKPNVLMAKVDLWEGVYYWNLHIKTNAPKTGVDVEQYKAAFMTVGTSARGCTFGVTLSNRTGRLWWTSAEGATNYGETVTVPAQAFSDQATIYLGAKNDTAGTFAEAETVKFSGIRVLP